MMDVKIQQITLKTKDQKNLFKQAAVLNMEEVKHHKQKIKKLAKII